MIDLFLSSQNIPFSVALVMLVGISLLEGVTTLMGAGFSHFLESLLPEMDVPEVDFHLETHGDIHADVGGDVGDHSFLAHLLGWIKVRGVPMIIVLVVFLTFFSLSGFLLQMVFKSVFSFYLPWYIAIAPALAVSLFLVRQTSLLLAKAVIKDETTAVSTETFIGKIAEITLGTATAGCPAEARLTDRFGQVHYLRVEPEDETETFPRGTQLLLVRKEGHLFKAIRNPNIKLTDN